MDPVARRWSAAGWYASCPWRSCRHLWARMRAAMAVLAPHREARQAAACRLRGAGDVPSGPGTAMPPRLIVCCIIVS